MHMYVYVYVYICVYIHFILTLLHKNTFTQFIFLDVFIFCYSRLIDKSNI